MRSLYTSMVGGLFMSLSACVLDRTGQSASTLYQATQGEQRVRMSNLENQFEALDRRLGQIEEYNRSRGQSEIMRMENLEDLREEVARMRGEMEVLQHDFDQGTLQELGRAADSDFRMLWLEDRAEALEQALGMGMAPAPDLDSSPADSLSGPDTDSNPSEVREKASDFEPVEGSAPVSAPPVESHSEAQTEAPVTPVEVTEVSEETVVAEAEVEDESSVVEDASSKPVAGGGQESSKIDPMALIRLAESHLSQGKETEARSALDRFLENFPEHEAVPRAQYRKAESFYNEGEYALAANGFKLVVERYRETKWAPYSMLRQGECFEALNRPDDAEAFYRALIQLWPKSRAAKEAKAKIQSLGK